MAKSIAKKPAAAKAAAATPLRVILKKPAAAGAAGAAGAKAGAKAPAAGAGSSSGADDGCDDLRDRLKSRKFEQIFNSLPDFVQQEYEDLNKLRDGTARSKITQLVNKTIQRVDGTLKVADTGGAWFQDLLQRQKTKYFVKNKDGGF